MKNWKKKLGELSFTKGYYFKMGDNGLVEKKDDQLIFTRKELEHFIEQELDRAREEGRREQQKLDGLLYGTTVATTTTLEEGWILKHKKKVEEELSNRLLILISSVVLISLLTTK